MSHLPDFCSYQYPTEYITDDTRDTDGVIDIDIKSSYMRARSHKYPENGNDEYIDTTYYDEESGSLDLGFQSLRKLYHNLYPEFSYLKILFIDHNNLSDLPDSKYLPNLEQLTCSSNHLTNIPFYPKLIFLNIANNHIISCKQYHKSGLKYFDCSYNQNFLLDFLLPHCRHLYINDTNISSIDLNLVPKLQYLDCGNNKLTQIMGTGNELIEINIQYNYINNIPDWPNLVRLMADFNDIKVLHTYPKLVSANITYNKLVQIKNQPSLKKLIASNNIIDTLGHMPELELLDLSHNNISCYHIPDHVEYVSLQFNPITSISLDPTLLKTLKELQVNFETYKHIYEKYYQYFEAVNVQINEKKLEYLLKKLNKVFDDNISRYVFRQFNSIKFKDREMTLFKISLKLFHAFFSLKEIGSIEELINTSEFKYLYHNITKFYYKTIVITLYFNGYHN
jgi:Leucine-rich repeat (LRR) protein